MLMNRWLMLVIMLVSALPGASRAATYQTIHIFAANTDMSDTTTAAHPLAPLVVDSSGALYGVVSENYPIAYKLTPPVTGTKWTKTTIFRFPLKGFSGCALRSNLVMDKAGNLYGTTLGCWDSDGEQNGLVYELSPPKRAGTPWTSKVIFMFVSGTVGVVPNMGLAIDHDGNLYGSTEVGNPVGKFFKLSAPKTAAGAWISSRLVNFSGDGHVLAVGDRFFVENSSGSSLGDIYEIVDRPTEHSFWRLFHFYQDIDHTDPVGGYPSGGLTMDQPGNLYGAANGGPNNASGLVFQLKPPASGSLGWHFSLLHIFDNTDGRVPLPVTADASDNLYGTTACGGKWATNATGLDSGEGVIFKLAPPANDGGKWAFTILYQPPKAFFASGNCNNTTAFNGPMVIGKDGALYGTANGPTGTGGSVFRFAP